MIHFKYNDKAKQYVFLKVDNNEDIKSINKLKEKMNLNQTKKYEIGTAI